MSQRIPFVRALWASTSLIAAAGIGFAAPAAAQDDETAQSSEGELPTIIVTANRREESLQDVAVSADILDEQRVNLIFSGAADTTALAGAAPGLNVESSNGRVAPRFYIRGLGNTDFDLAASQPVSVILDEIVLENVTLKSFPIFDVQRVEVLRGPQGTLFGRNTPAGIVKIETVKPGFEPDVQAGLSFGSLDTASLTGAVGGAIVEDKLAFRVSTQFQRPRRLDRQRLHRRGECARRVHRFRHSRPAAVDAGRTQRDPRPGQFPRSRRVIDLLSRERSVARQQRVEPEL
ncbi:iron complex outermembrane recepter protein [Erythrobacter litoralis]|uniref:TonB-dependent receptor plug domain-containing protein n=1 Tax=Erythrobacter litoralis TaxID=39960 RepID=UPI000863A076|nr:TonB-dependent receptor plug domain-containing protein [Erythrobacter litoralis]AOL24151.1 iron complex outermembrane recepter protein [Erythrobacter litoralis]